MLSNIEVTRIYRVFFIVYLFFYVIKSFSSNFIEYKIVIANFTIDCFYYKAIFL